jgi:hypothetical protein
LRFEKEKALRLMSETSARILRLKKQQEFLRSKDKDMVRCGLKTLDKLEEAEGKERQEEERKRATEAAAILSTIVPKSQSDPFTRLEIPLLPLKV